MKLVTAGRLKVFHPKILLFVFVFITVSVSVILFQTTKANHAGNLLPKYTLSVDVKSLGWVQSFNFVHSCLSSDSDFLCKPKNEPVRIFAGVFSTLNLTSDVTPGTYRGIGVRINGNKDNFFYVKSIRLQGKTVFDGKNFSLFKNVKGMKISRDIKTNLPVFNILSDSASFELDCSFAVTNGTAVKYTNAVLFSVLFISLIMLLSIFGKSGRMAGVSPDSERNAEGLRGNTQRSDAGNIYSPRNNKRHKLICVWGDSQESSSGVKSTVLRISLVALVFDLLFLILSVCGQLFLFNEFSVVQATPDGGSFKVEVSDSRDFSYTIGSASFLSGRSTLIRIPERFSSVRIIKTSEDQPDSVGFKVTATDGSCGVNGRSLESNGALACSLDGDGRLYINLASHNAVSGIFLAALAALAIAAFMYLAFRFIEFNSAVRMMLIFIMISAYITGEICMNIESDNVIFYRNYLQLLPYVGLKNICLILCIFLLAELSFSRGFICSGTFLQVLLLTIVYIAIDWGVSSSFGMRADIRTMMSHSGANNSTFLVFAKAFFRTSHASWMVLVMVADWIIMALSFRRRESHSLKKYLLLILVLNCIPFLKVYENFYTESGYQLRQDIFDIQCDTLHEQKTVYTSSFSEYSWKPEYQVIDGLNRRKNVVIVLVESLINAYSHHFSGLRGYMPNMDALAADNVSFINYHATGVETVPATYSLLTGKLFFTELDSASRDLHFEYDEAFPNLMKAEGYSTYAISSSMDFGGLDEIYRNSGFDHIYDTNDPAYNGVQRYHFNSVADGVLLQHAAELIKGFDQSERPHLTFIMTASSHNPFINPETRKQGYAEVISYVDREIGKFVRKLEENGFFDNGTLIITGDHYPPGIDFAPGEVNRYGEDVNRVPLIVIDRDLGRQVFQTVLGHDSLGVIIEYLNLKKVKKYEYQVIPFWKPDEGRNATVLCPILYQSVNLVGGIRVSGPNGEQGIYDANGDKSEFTSHFLDPESEKEIAGRVKWFKREE